MGAGYIGLSANFAVTERWVLDNTRRGVSRKLFLEHMSITSSQTYIHEVLAPAYIKQEIKAVGKPVDVLEDVITMQCLQACPWVFEMTTEVSDD